MSKKDYYKTMQKSFYKNINSFFFFLFFKYINEQKRLL